MSAYSDGLCHPELSLSPQNQTGRGQFYPQLLGVLSPVLLTICSHPQTPAGRVTAPPSPLQHGVTGRAACASSPSHASPAPGFSCPLRRGAWPPPTQTASLSGKSLQNGETRWWSRAGWGWLAHFRLRLLFIWAFWGGPAWGSLPWPHVSRPQEPQPG